jgi:glycine cleavage system transcriptional repressor
MHTPLIEAILSAAGADRPGLLDEVSKYLLEHGAEVRQIKMTSLRGQFAMLVLIEGDRATLSTIRDHLPNLADHTSLKLALFDAGAEVPGAGHPYRLRMSGTDETEALQRISHLLRVLGINIDTVETRPDPGLAILAGDAAAFAAELVLSIPRDKPVTNIREYIDQLMSELKVKWELTAL